MRKIAIIFVLFLIFGFMISLSSDARIILDANYPKYGGANYYLEDVDAPVTEEDVDDWYTSGFIPDGTPPVPVWVDEYQYVITDEPYEYEQYFSGWMWAFDQHMDYPPWEEYVNNYNHMYPDYTPDNSLYNGVDGDLIFDFVVFMDDGYYGGLLEVQLWAYNLMEPWTEPEMVAFEWFGAIPEELMGEPYAHHYPIEAEGEWVWYWYQVHMDIPYNLAGYECWLQIAQIGGIGAPYGATVYGVFGDEPAWLNGGEPVPEPATIISLLFAGLGLAIKRKWF